MYRVLGLGSPQKQSLVLRLILAALLAVGVMPAASQAAASPECEAYVLGLKDKSPIAYNMAKELQAFADEHNLPSKVITVGPPERLVKRLVVGVDSTNEALVAAYLKRFNLDAAPGEGVAATLALEFQRENPGNYVTGVLRPSSDPAAPIYRWGRPDLPRASWWKDWVLTRGGVKADGTPAAIVAYSHLIGLTEAQQANVKEFLAKPAHRAPCKSDNCVAWTSSIELGKTIPGATNEERNFLFSELGMSRSMAHFEIGRRLLHAANERHSAVVAFLSGPEAVKEWDNLTGYFPPEPQIPYTNVIKGLGGGVSKETLDAVQGALPQGGKVFLPIAAGASPAAFTALTMLSGKVYQGFDVHLLVNGLSESALRQAAEHPDRKMRLSALFLGGNMRALGREGKVNVIPGYLSDFNRLVRQSRDFKYDAIVVRVSPADEQGRHSFGPNADMIMDILRDLPNIKVIAEINPNVPFTTGENWIPHERINTSFESNDKLAGPPVVPLSQTEKTIGQYIASLVPSDAYLQIGIGNIFGGMPAAMEQLKTRGIRIHTEMFGDPLKEMIELGIADNARTGFAYGSEALYKWLDRNTKVIFKETAFVNDPARVASLDNFHAVNTALQIDLLGNVNATMGPGGQRISSPGGQVEFMSGASRSAGGKAIIAIRSTAKNDELSTITLDLYSGSVTTPHESVTHIVTEYGVAALAGKNERERACAILKIAHPKFRKALFEQAKARNLLDRNCYVY